MADMNQVGLLYDDGDEMRRGMIRAGDSDRPAATATREA